jgi:hypothetical protein
VKSGQLCTVTLDVADCLGVGHSLRALVAQGRLDAETRETYDRVGKQLVAAGRASVEAAVTEAWRPGDAQ